MVLKVFNNSHNEPSQDLLFLEEIKDKLPLPPRLIAKIAGYDIDDKTKGDSKTFGALLNRLKEAGHIVEKKGKNGFLIYPANHPELSRVAGKVPAPKTETPLAKELSEELLGVVHAGKETLYFEPLDAELGKFKISDKVSVNVGDIITAKLNSTFDTIISVVKTHGTMNDANALGKLSALSAGIPIEFPDDILSDSEPLTIPKVSRYRKDFTDIPFITIDPVNAEDFDDAVHVRRTSKGWRVFVAIADVSHYVKPGTKLSKEALKRGNSTYLPDMVIPMLPEELSNGVCSLKPNEFRACVVCTMDIDKNGNILSRQFERGLMKSRHRLNYDQVQAAIDDDKSQLPKHAWRYIPPLLEVYNARLKDKKKRGALDIDAPQQRVTLKKGRDISLALEVGNQAHGIIEELMICANISTAQVLKESGQKFISRAHGEPIKRIFDSLSDDLKELGIRIPKQGSLRDKFISILKQASQSKDPDSVRVTVARMQDLAKYSTDDSIGHYGLALKDYTHFTSPIRRATDLFVHHQINTTYQLGDGHQLNDDMSAKMDKYADHFSNTERRSEHAERLCRGRYVALWMKGNLSNTFQAQVSGIEKGRLWVTVNAQDTTIHAALDKKDVIGSVQDYRSGLAVTIQPVEANPVTGVIRFKMINPNIVLA